MFVLRIISLAEQSEAIRMSQLLKKKKSLNFCQFFREEVDLSSTATLFWASLCPDYYTGI